MGTTQENLAEEALEVARRILGPDVEIKFEVTYINKYTCRCHISFSKFLVLSVISVTGLLQEYNMLTKILSTLLMNKLYNLKTANCKMFQLIGEGLLQLHI